MKSTTPASGTGEGTRSNRTFHDSQRPETSSCNAVETYREPRFILMCWRAFRPEDVEDRNVESMSSAGNNDIQVQIEMPRVSAFQGEV